MPNTQKSYKKINMLRERYYKALSGKESLAKLILESEVAEQVYNSNAIENSTLSLDETEKILLQIDLDRYISERELFEAKNLARVVEYIESRAKEKELNLEIILFLHKILLSNIRDEVAGRIRAKGEFVRVGNYIAPAPDKLARLLEEMFVEYNSKTQENIIKRIARLHLRFEHIHPFIDGNGRIGRAINNYLLIREGYVPINIKFIDRASYYNAFKEFDEKGATTGMEEIVGKALINSYYKRLAYLEGKEIINLAEYAKRKKLSHPNLINKAKRQTIEAFLEKGIWKIGLTFCLALFSFLMFSPKISLASSLSYELRGNLLIEVENRGQAWYVDNENGLRHILNQDSFLETVRQNSLGISNANLLKIPVAIDNRLIRIDSDGDGLDDRLERALGTDPLKSDSDDDSYGDAHELKYHYNPLGTGRLPIDLNFTKKLSGQFLLQVEGKGELWYLSPRDNLRYYIGDYDDLMKIVSILGRGINKENINLIADARLISKAAVKNIKVDVSKKQRVYYYLGETQIGSFPVSAGKASMPTPKGEFSIINKHPKAWSSYGLWMPYWQGLGTGRFGFHELPVWPSGYREGEDHLGVAVSHGCIRLGVGPAEFLYNWAPVGTKVLIY